MVTHQSTHCVDQLINQNIKLTINREVAIIANHIAAFFKILNHVEYFLESPPEVIIWNQAHKHNIKATKDNIHNIRFTAVCMVIIRASSCVFSVQGTDI